MFFVPTPRLFRSSTFRLALLYMGIFSVSVFLLLAFIYWSTAGYMVRQTEATIEAEMTGLSEQYDLAGMTGLTSVIRERLSRYPSGRSLYLLVDHQFKPILGNFGEWPKGKRSDQGWFRLQVEIERSGLSEKYPALARILRLKDEGYLLVGQDIRDFQNTEKLIREALLGGVLITLFLGLVGGTMMSRAMMHRIELINSTCREIINGSLSKRIPRTGGDDDFDTLIDNLNVMLDRIEELMHSVKQVTNNIAHDLRTPLTHLRRRLDMLREAGASGEDNQDLLDQAILEADSLLATFKALLRISEVEVGGRRNGFEAVNMTALLGDLIELYQPLIEENGQSFDSRLVDVPPIAGDRNLLFQAFANLLDNAIKYTPEVGEIHVELVDSPDELKVLIRDSGPGIPVDARKHVFERFYRLEASRSTPGNGLGLSLVAAIIRLHHGAIALDDNQPGLSTTVTLPREA